MTFDPSLFAPPAGHPAEPLLAVACPSCHGALAVAAGLAGGAARCPLCAGGFLVPLPEPVPAAVPLPVPEPGEMPVDPAAESAPVSAQPPAAALQPRGEWEFQEPVKTIGSGDAVIELHRLTPREKAARRARRNLIMLLLGVSILMAIVLIFGTKRDQRR